MQKLFAVFVAAVLSAIMPQIGITQTWQIEVVDTTGYVGAFSSIDLDNNGYPHIGYYHAIDLLGELKYARWTV
ncbi:MAG: hypothetical protein AB1393_11670 [Candidatus Edwardsbacteria bacterium]